MMIVGMDCEQLKYKIEYYIEKKNIGHMKIQSYIFSNASQVYHFRSCS